MNVQPRPTHRTGEMNRLVLDNLDVARRIALRVARRIPDWLSADDLISSAMVGLTEAAERYDASRGEPFIAFAEKRIRGAVLDELRRGDMMPRRARTAARNVSKTIAKVEQQLGRPAEDEEVAAALGVSVEEYREDLEGLTHVALVNIDDERGANLRDSGQSPAAQAERSELIQQLHDGLTKIPARDALILNLYYVESLGYAEIGQTLGVSESRVCQLHSRALLRLKAEVNPDVTPKARPTVPARACA